MRNACMYNLYIIDILLNDFRITVITGTGVGMMVKRGV